jgi:hypothetical protein
MPAWLKIAAIVILPLFFVSPSLATSDFDPDETQRLYFEALDQCEQTGYDKTQPSCKIYPIYADTLDANGWCQHDMGRRPLWRMCSFGIDESWNSCENNLTLKNGVFKFSSDHFEDLTCEEFFSPKKNPVKLLLCNRDKYVPFEMIDEKTAVFNNRIMQTEAHEGPLCGN